MTDLDLTRWCQQSAAKYREYEHINMAAAEDRDVAIVEWVVRVLGNPEVPESRQVLDILRERHDAPRPRVWPQDHATDVTVLGPVLTEEPADSVTEVWDGQGARFCRNPGSRSWRCVPGGPPFAFAELVQPVRGSAS